MTSFLPLAVAVVVVMGLRVRRMMTEQVYRPATIWSRVVLLVLLAVFILGREAQSRLGLAGIAVGFIGGLILGGFSLRHTRFRYDADSPGYQTNPYIGALVVVLFAIRILYDASAMRALNTHLGAIDPLSSGWLSALLYFLFVAYWGVYYIGLIRAFKRHHT